MFSKLSGKTWPIYYTKDFQFGVHKDAKKFLGIKYKDIFALRMDGFLSIGIEEGMDSSIIEGLPNPIAKKVGFKKDGD